MSPATIVAVVRRDVQLDVDPLYDINHGEGRPALYLRGTVVVGQPDGAVRITFTA